MVSQSVYIYIPHFLCLIINWQTSGFIPFLSYCKLSCNFFFFFCTLNCIVPWHLMCWKSWITTSFIKLQNIFIIKRRLQWSCSPLVCVMATPREPQAALCLSEFTSSEYFTWMELFNVASFSWCVISRIVHLRAWICAWFMYRDHILYKYVQTFVYSSIDDYLSCFQLFAVMSTAAINIPWRSMLATYFQFFWVYN